MCRLIFPQSEMSKAWPAVDVKSRVAGQVLRVAFQEGQNVEKGQLLFEIDPEPINRQLAEIQANLSKDVALEEQAKANVTKDEAQIKQTRAAADRGVELAKEGIFSKEQTEQVVATNDTALASLDADKAAINSAEASIRADRARLAQTQLQLTYTKILRPSAAARAPSASRPAISSKTTMRSWSLCCKCLPSTSPSAYLKRCCRNFKQGLKGDGAGKNGVLQFIDNSVDTTTGTIKIKAKFENAEHALVARRVRERPSPSEHGA